MQNRFMLSAFLFAFAAGPVAAAPFNLLTGVDAGRWPGADRSVSPDPGPGFPRTFNDGDRLAGTSDVGGTIEFQGLGTPFHPPNHLGTLSLLIRRGSIAIPPSNRQPLMGIDFLGGPLLDLDGDLNNGGRSLIPVVVDFQVATPVEIPGTSSFVDLSFDFASGTVTVNDFDATGSSEGGEGISAEIATTLTTIAGTLPDGGKGPSINPAFDTRTGTLVSFSGAGGTLIGVFRIDGLQVELWHDTIFAGSATAADLGTFQYFLLLRGWLVLRDCGTGLFPTLAGEGFGSTVWPAVDVSHVGSQFNTAIDVFGPTATITDGVSGDVFSAAGNGGLVLADFGGDLGAYLDGVVVPLVGSGADAFVYLESAGCGINNSGDPVFTDTVGYDVVLIAEATGPTIFKGDINADGCIDLADADAMVSVLLEPGAFTPDEQDRADVNEDQVVNGLDVQAFLNAAL